MDEKIVLITGGSRGIGRATALKFAKRGGVKVIINYRNNDMEAQKVVKEIEKLHCPALAIKADISKKSEIDRLVSTCIENFGRIDILINNAGIVYDREFEDIKYNESLEIIKTNMLAPLFLSQKIAPYMLKQGSGCIVNVSSTSGMYDFNPGTADYAMSKLALQSLTKDLSMKYAPTIRVNAVAPGWVNTDMNADLPEDFIKSETAKYHLHRWAEPEEIADGILYLVSDNATYMTGHVLVMDGGHC